MSSTGIPSVIAITVSMPASIASSIAGAAKRAGTKIIEVLAPRSPTGLGDRVEDGHAVDVLAALAGGDAGDQVGAVVAVAEPVEGALAAGEAGDDQLGVGADDDAHLSVTAAGFGYASTRQLDHGFAAPSIVFSTCRLPRFGLGEEREALGRVGAVEADDHGHARSRSAARPR